MGYVERLLGQHEKLILVSRQHWITLLGSALVNLALAVVIVVVIFFVSFYMPTSVPLIYLGLVLLLIPAVRFVFHFLVWDNREYIITNRRVIQIDGIVNKSVIDSSLEKVNDVEMRQSLLGRMLDFGNVEILTASSLAPNLFHNIASPVKFKTAMLNQKEAMTIPEELKQAGIGAAVPPAPDVPTMIEHLDQLRQRGVISEAEFQQKKQELLARI